MNVERSMQTVSDIAHGYISTLREDDCPDRGKYARRGIVVIANDLSKIW